MATGTHYTHEQSPAQELAALLAVEPLEPCSCGVCYGCRRLLAAEVLAGLPVPPPPTPAAVAPVVEPPGEPRGLDADASIDLSSAGAAPVPAPWRARRDRWRQMERLHLLPEADRSHICKCQMIPSAKPPHASDARLTPWKWCPRCKCPIASNQVQSRRAKKIVARVKHHRPSALLHCVLTTPGEARPELVPSRTEPQGPHRKRHVGDLLALQAAAERALTTAWAAVSAEDPAGVILAHPCGKREVWAPHKHAFVALDIAQLRNVQMPSVRARFVGALRTAWHTELAAVCGLAPEEIQRPVVHVRALATRDAMMRAITRESRHLPGWGPLSLRFVGAWWDRPPEAEESSGYVPLAAFPRSIIDAAPPVHGIPAADLLDDDGNLLVAALGIEDRLHEPGRRVACTRSMAPEGVEAWPSGTETGVACLLTGADAIAHADKNLAQAVRRVRDLRSAAEAAPVVDEAGLREADRLLRGLVAEVESYAQQVPSRWWQALWLRLALAGEPSALAASPPLGACATLNVRYLDRVDSLLQWLLAGERTPARLEAT